MTNPQTILPAIWKGDQIIQLGNVVIGTKPHFTPRKRVVKKKQKFPCTDAIDNEQ